MADTSDLEKTEPASERRLQQAREQGQVVRSTELTAFVLLAVGLAGIWLLGGSLLGDLGRLLGRGLGVDAADAVDAGAMMAALADIARAGALAAAPLLALLFAAAVVAPLALGGWNLSFRPLIPDPARLNPLNGFSRVLSLHGLVELAKALAKAVLVGGVAAVALHANAGAIVSLAASPLEEAVAALATLVAAGVAAPVAALGAIAVADVPYQWWSHRARLRMSREELRREHKESEGDPHIKARIRSLQRDAARRRMLAEVPRADVVLTNPTRFAVALRYEEGRGAPRVVARGARLLAARIRELAAAHGVPVIEAPALTRALYRHAQLGDEVPVALYAAVAEVLAYVYGLRRGAAHGRPPAPAVPEGFDFEGVA